jgi:hypothetical protein
MNDKLTKDDKYNIRIVVVGISIASILAIFLWLYKIADYFILKNFTFCPVNTRNNNDIIEQAAHFGDLVGGLLGTFLAAIGTGFLVYTFYHQQLNFRKERFENRFFELMKIYRDSVLEMNIGDKVLGRKCFMFMFKEFKFIYYVAKITFEKNKSLYSSELGFQINDIKVVNNKLSDIAFEIFFFGIGTDSEKIFKTDPLISTEFYEKVKLALESYQKSFIESTDDLKCLSTFSIYENGVKESLRLKGLLYEFETKYYPFDGHISRLGHYYRQLFQIVRYVALQEDDFLNKEEVLEHLKILRTQMSNHEQLLLYYNGMSGIGLKWTGDDKNNNKNYFKEYQMIHNLPIPLADVGHLPDDEYSDELKEEYDIFEWY